MALLALIAWALFAFAGAYRSVTLLVIIGAVCLAAAVRPRLFPARHVALDAALTACLAVLALQLVPLPPGVRAQVSPGAAAVDRALLLTPLAVTSRPITLDPNATRWALATAAALMLIFWSARSLFERTGGVRTVARGIAWVGLLLAVITLMQKTLSPEHIYGIVSPTSRSTSPAPHGPFVNRNDFAMWVIMAIPMVLGYILARLASRRRAERSAIDVESAFDSRMIWLVVSACLLAAALLASLSRGGLSGLAVALLVLVLLARRRLPAAQARWLVAGIGAILLVGAMYANLPALADRLGAALPSGLGGRLAVWRETWPIVGDFTLAGVGAGAFGRAMLVYQQSTRLIFFNHAHNQYLQTLVEGGLLLAVPAAAALLLFSRELLRRLRTDRSAMFWIRAGAAAAFAAVATQCIWDTGLRLTANGVLFAIIAAVAIHEPEPGESSFRSASSARQR